MENFNKKGIKQLFIIALTLSFTFTSLLSATQGKTAGYGLKNKHNSGQSSHIHSGNVNNLELEWTYRTQLAFDGGDEEFAGVETHPLLKAGVLYFPDAFGNLHAVDKKTGNAIWKKSFFEDYSNFTDRIIHLSRNTPVVKGSTIYVAAGGTLLSLLPGIVCETNNFFEGCLPGGTGVFLLAINRSDGELVWATQLNDHFGGLATASPVLFQNKIFVTMSNLEEIIDGVFDPVTGTNPDDPLYRCCQARNKTVAVNLDGTIAWEFFHTPSFDGPNNDNSPTFQTKLDAFESAVKEYLADLDPNDPFFVEEVEPLPPMAYFSGAASWGKGNPPIDRQRGLILVAPGSNYSIPDLVRQCQRVRQGSIAPPPGNKDYTLGALDPAAYLPTGITCDNINEELDNYLNSVVALDVNTGNVVWVMRDDLFDTWNANCHSHDATYPHFFANLFPPIDFNQKKRCDPLIRANDFGFAQVPMILRNVDTGGSLIDIGVIGQKSGDLYRFDMDTGGDIFFDRKKIGQGGIFGGLHYPQAADKNRIYMVSSNTHGSYRDMRDPFVSTRDDDGFMRPDGLVFVDRESDPRLPARRSGPSEVRTLVNPSPDTFIDADVRITYDADCNSVYDVGSISHDLCNGINPLNLSDPNIYSDTEKSESSLLPSTNRFKRVVTIEPGRDWRDKPLGFEINGVTNPNTVDNPISDNVASNPANKIMTVRDLEDCTNPADPTTCAIKTLASFWFAVYASSGEIVWSRPHPAGGFINSAMTLSRDLLYTGASGNEQLYIDPVSGLPGATEVPSGGGLRFALNKYTGEIVSRIHDTMKNAGEALDEYVVGDPLVLKKRVIWGSGWGHYGPVDITQTDNKLHSLRLVQQAEEAEADEFEDSEGEDNDEEDD